MTTPAPPVPVAQPPRHVVKVLTERRTWTSPRLLPDEAAEVRASLRSQIAAAGDSPALVTFGGRDGRDVDVRAREVIAIECGPASEFTPRPTNWTGDVHLHMTGELQPPATVPVTRDGLIPTPAVLDRSRR